MSAFQRFAAGRFHISRFHIRPSRARATLLAGAAAAASAFCAGAGAQVLDGTLEDAIEDEADRQVEGRLADELEQNVAAELEGQVEQEVAGQVEQEVEQSVADAVAGEIESSVSQAVEANVESSVADGVESQVEAAVAETVEGELESSVAGAVEQQLENGVTEAVEEQVEAGVSDALESRLESAVGDIERTVGQGGDDGMADAVEPGVERAVEDAARLLEPAGPGQGEGGADGDGGADAGAEPEAAQVPFSAAADAVGRAIERNVWVVLVPSEHEAVIEQWGFSVRERADLATLDRILLRIDAPEDRSIAQAALDLALDAPGTTVDFNHVYAPEADEASTVARPQPAPAEADPPVSGAAVGLIDTAIDASHEAFRGTALVERDFVPFRHERATQHGTSVGSILAERLGPGGRLLAASVFFVDDSGDSAATTTSLVRALDWLASEGVAVTNMSLSGPPNRVLEVAIERTVERGGLVVAAVGNNGPTGEPLYPAGYETVVGVTAVDARNRVYRYANRGRHVMFAAPGVRVRAARSGGGYRDRTGTSIAAPHAAAIIARAVHAQPTAKPGDVVALLSASALDLGDEAFDEVYGHGLIAPLD